MRMLGMMLVAGMIGLAGCKKEPALKMPDPGQPVAPATKGPSPEEVAARAEIEKQGGTFHKEVAIGMAGLRIELPKTTTDKDLKQLIGPLKAFPKIDELDLSHSAITFAGLAELKALKNLGGLAIPEKLMGHAMLREVGESNPGLSIRGPDVSAGGKRP